MFTNPLSCCPPLPGFNLQRHPRISACNVPNILYEVWGPVPFASVLFSSLLHPSHPFRSLPFSSLPFCSLPRHLQSRNYIGGFSLRYSPSNLIVCLSLGISLFTINPLCCWSLFVPCIWTRFNNGVLWRYPLADMPASQCEPVRPQFALHALPTSLSTLALVHADE